jgi:tRNA modification GTPase
VGLDVVLYVMPGPHSYTGEDVVEIHHHGGTVITEWILDHLEQVRGAEPGEFTRRAFLNGKLDLAQAESVMALIRATSDASHRRAVGLLHGSLGAALGPVEENLLMLCALAEADIDFSDQDIDVLDADQAKERVSGMLADLRSILESDHADVAAATGARIVLAGRPNAGKSSLLNALVRSDRAIVTDTPGTTRDAVEVELELPGGTRVTICDTAGIRETDDPLEREGQGRGERAVQGADLVVRVIDPEEYDPDDIGDGEILFFNKSDVWDASDLFVEGKAVICVGSAVTGEGIAPLLDVVEERIVPGDALLPRHRDCLRRAVGHLEKAETAFREGMSPEFAAFDLRAGLEAIGEMTGRLVTEDILDRIFSSFCIGK